MLKRPVLINDAVYTCHVINAIHVTSNGRMVYVNSYISESDIEDKTKSPISRAYLQECDTSTDYVNAENYIASLQDFTEHHDALDEVLAMLTDEQAMLVPHAFKQWEPGVHYTVDDRRLDSGELYKCLMTHTSQEDWQPSTTPALWARIGAENEVPVWSQPDSTNPFMKGDRVYYPDADGEIYVSDVDNNVWEPTVYGWTVE